MAQEIEIERVGTIALIELRDDTRPPYLIVKDAAPSFQIRFFVDAARARLCVYLSSSASEEDHALYGLTDCTSGVDGCAPPDCAIGEVRITEDGLLSAMARQPARYEIHRGWTARVPIEAVPLVRRAIEISEARANGQVVPT